MYRRIFEAWNRERENIDLQPLGDGFYKEVEDYSESLKEGLKNNKSSNLEFKLQGNELKRIRFMVEDLVKRRFSKVVQTILEEGGTVGGSILTREERRVHDYLKKCNGILDGMVDVAGEYTHILRERHTIEEKDVRLTLLRFLKPVPEIVGADLKIYGPFDSEDLATLPNLNARFLIVNGLALEVQWSFKPKEHAPID